MSANKLTTLLVVLAVAVLSATVFAITIRKAGGDGTAARAPVTLASGPSAQHSIIAVSFRPHAASKHSIIAI
jgi:hypothetical protein